MTRCTIKVPCAKRQFGVSTHLYHGRRLSRDHLLEIAAHGFETVEVFATRTHFDYHNPAAIADLQQWLAEAGLTLHAIHAPVMQAYEAGRWKGPLSLASVDGEARAQAMSETELRALRSAPDSRAGIGDTRRAAAHAGADSP